MCNFEQLVIAVFLQIFLAADVDPFDISPLIIYKFRHKFVLNFLKFVRPFIIPSGTSLRHNCDLVLVVNRR